MKEAASALWASIVRTVVPIIVGFFLQVAVTWNIVLDPEFEGLLTALLTVVFTTAYYVAVRLFETYISPKLGWLLGWGKSPDSYSEESPAKPTEFQIRVNEAKRTFPVPGPHNPTAADPERYEN